MSRIRTIKPEFFKHEDLFDLEQETGLPVRLVFIGIWTQCDREGRFEWRPRKLKTDIMPFDDLDFSRVLDALATRGFVVKYEVEGKVFGCVPSFSKHQVINTRERASDIPQNPQDTENANDLTRAPRVDDACPTRYDLAQGERELEREGEEEQYDTARACENVGLSFREKILSAIGADPISGFYGPNANLGTESQIFQAKRWLGLGLSEQEIIACLRESVDRAARQNPPKVIKSLTYFNGAMADFAAVKAAPPLRPSANSTQAALPKPPLFDLTNVRFDQ